MVSELEKDPLDMYRTCCPYECQDPEKWKKPKCLLVKVWRYVDVAAVAVWKKKTAHDFEPLQNYRNWEWGNRPPTRKTQGPPNRWTSSPTNKPIQTPTQNLCHTFSLKHDSSVLGHVANPFSNTCFFFGGGILSIRFGPKKFCTPKKRENFSPWNRLNWPRSVQLDVLPAALLTVTRGTQGGGELEKIGSAAMKCPRWWMILMIWCNELVPFPRKPRWKWGFFSVVNGCVEVTSWESSFESFKFKRWYLIHVNLYCLPLYKMSQPRQKSRS